MSQSGRENRLSRETSPYLLQHARNPVDWYPWGSEALERARTEDKPILLSIGYSACHWCHVMERESFEDGATARLMNEHFVCIKVDREERPDLDLIYMNAVQIMTGSGGWPLTVFLTPSLKPFYGGTYFPPESRHGMPAFQAVLTRVAQAYREQRDKVAASGDQITGYIEKMSQVVPSEESLTDDLQLAALAQFKANFDTRHGGWGSPPKFPQAHAISLLFRIHRRLADAEARSSAELTLEKMARGGMYDQLGGGFHRYSTDARWLVPHFEKMLYDQALLVPAYLEGYQLGGRELFARVARECLDYVAREMTSQEGGFFSAQDADSEGVEGKFFVWTPEEIREVAGDTDARYFGAYYDVTKAGNWEGRSILNVPRGLPEVAREIGIPPEELERSLSRSRQKLLERREKRVRPGLDDKILTAWNGLMVSAFARGYQVLGEPRYLESARCAARFLLTKMRGKDGNLRRTYRQGVAKLGGCLDDYAFLAAGLLDLYESDFDPNWFEEVRVLLDGMVRNFWDEKNGAFFFTATDEGDLIVRSKTGHDGALPSGNSVASLLLLRMARLTGESRDGEKALRILRAYREPMGSMPAGFAQMLCALDFHLDEPKEVAVVGEGNDPGFQELLRVVRGEFLPNKVLAATTAEGSGAKSGKPAVELLAGKKSVGGKPTAYVCQDFKCRKPTCDPEELKDLLTERSTKRRRKE